MQKENVQNKILDQPDVGETLEEQKIDNLSALNQHNQPFQQTQEPQLMQDKAVNIAFDKLGKNSFSPGELSADRNQQPNQEPEVNMIQTESILVPQDEEKKDQKLKISDLVTPQKQGNLTSQISEVQSGSIESVTNSSKNRGQKLTPIASPERSADLPSSPEPTDEYAVLRQESPVKRLNMVLSMADVKDSAPKTPIIDEDVVLSQTLPSQQKMGKRFEFDQSEIGDLKDDKDLPMELSAANSSLNPMSQEQKLASSLSGYTDLTNSNLAESQQPNSSGPLQYSYSLGAESLLISPASVTGVQLFDHKYDVSQNIPFQTILQQEIEKLKLNHVLELRSLQDILKQKQKEINYLQDVISNQRNQTQETQNNQKMKQIVQDQEANFKSELERRDLKIKRLEAEIESLKKDKPMDNSSSIELELYELRIKSEIKEFELTAKFKQELSQLTKQIENQEAQRITLLDQNHQLMEQAQNYSQKIKSKDEMEIKNEELQNELQRLKLISSPLNNLVEEDIKRQTQRLKELLAKIENTIIKEKSISELNRLNDFIAQRLSYTQQKIKQLENDIKESKSIETKNLEQLKQQKDKSRQLERELQQIKLECEQLRQAKEREIQQIKEKHQIDVLEYEEEIEELREQNEALQRKTGRNLSQPSPNAQAEPQIDEKTKASREALKQMVEDSMKTVVIKDMRILELESQISNCVEHLQRINMLEQEKSTFMILENDLRAQINTLNNKLEFHINQIEKPSEEQKVTQLHQIPKDNDVSFGAEQVQTLQNQNESLKLQLNQSQQELERARKERTDGVKEFNQQIEILQLVLEKKESQVDQQQKEIEKLQKTITSNEREQSSIKEQLLVQQQSQLEQKTQLKQSNDENKKLQSQLYQLKQEIQNLNNENAELVKKIQNEASKYQILNEESQQNKQRSVAEIDLLKEKINNQQYELDGFRILTQEQQNSKEQMEEYFKEKNDQLEKQAQKYQEELNQNIQLQNTSLIDFTNQLSEKDKEIENLKQGKVNLQKIVDELTAQQEEFKNESQKVKLIIQQLQEKLEDSGLKCEGQQQQLQKLNCDLQQIMDDRNHLQGQLRVEQQKVLDLQNMLNQSSNQDQELYDQLSKKIQIIQILQQDLNDLTQQQKVFDEKNASLISELKSFKNENELLKKQVDDLGKRLQKEQEDSLRQKIILDAQVENLKLQIQNQNSDLQNLQIQNLTIQDTQEGLLQENQNLKDQLRKTQKDCEKINESLVQTEKTLQTLETQSQEYQSLLKKSDDQIQELQQKLNRSEDTVQQQIIYSQKDQLRIENLLEDQTSLKQQNLLQKQQIDDLFEQEQRLRDEIVQLKQLQSNYGQYEQQMNDMLQELNEKQKILRSQEGQIRKLENQVQKHMVDIYNEKDLNQQQQAMLKQQLENKSKDYELQLKRNQLLQEDCDQKADKNKQLIDDLNVLNNQINIMKQEQQERFLRMEEQGLRMSNNEIMIDQLKKDLHTRGEILQERMLVIDDLEQKLQKVQMEKVKLEEDIDEIRKAQDKIQQKSNDQSKDLNLQVLRLQQQLQEKQDDLDGQTQATNNLQKKLNEYVQSQDFRKEKDKEVEEKQAQINQLMDQSNQLNEIIKNLSTIIDQKEIIETQQNSIINKLRSDNDDKVAQLKSKEFKIQQLINERSELEERVQKDELNLRNDIKKLMIEQDILQNRCFDLDSSYKQLQEKNQTLTSQILEDKDQSIKQEQLDNLIKVLKEAEIQTQQQVEQNQWLKDQLKKSELLAGNLEQINQKLSEDYEATKLHLMETQTKFMDSLLKLENFQSQLEQTNREKQNLEQALQKIQIEVKMIRDGDRKTEEQQIQIKIQNSQIDELSQQLQTYKDEYDLVRNQNHLLLEQQILAEDQSEEISSLKDQIGMLKEQNQSLQTLIKSKNQEIQGLSKNIEQYIQNLNDQQDLVNTVRGIQDEIKKKDEMCDTLQLKIRELQDQAQKQQQIIQLLQEEKSAYDHEIQKLKETHDEVLKLKDLSKQLQKQIGHLKKEEQVKNTLLLQQKQQSINLKKELQISEQQRDHLKTLLEQQQNSIQQKENCINNHQKTIENLQQQILANKKALEKKINDTKHKLLQSEMYVKELQKEKNHAQEVAQYTILKLQEENNLGQVQSDQKIPAQNQEQQDKLIQALQKDNSSFQHQIFELKRDYETQIKQLRSKLLDSGKYSRFETQKIRDLNTQNEALSATIMKLTEQTDFLQNQLQKFNVDHQRNQVDIQEELVQSVQENKKLQQQIQRQNGQIYSYKKIIMDLEKRFTEQNKQFVGRYANSFLQGYSPDSVSPQPQNQLVYSKTSQSKVIKRPFKETQSQNEIYRSTSQEKPDPQITFDLQDSRVQSIKRSLKSSIKNTMDQTNYLSLKFDEPQDRREDKNEKSRIYSLPGSGKTPEKMHRKRQDRSFLKQIRPASVQFKQTPKRDLMTPQRERPVHRQTQSISDDYKGDTQSGLRHGRGRYVYPNGNVYEGEWYKDQRYGYGSLKDQNGDIYLGYWQFDQMNGCGHLKNMKPEPTQEGLDYKNLDTIGNKWLSYQGEFQQGLFHGYGTLTLTNSERFHGSFAKGKANGRGTYYRMNGEIIPGSWKNNYFVDRNSTK